MIDLVTIDEKRSMLTLKEVARVLGVSVDTVRRRVREKKLQAKNVGQSKRSPRWRVRPEWLDEYVERDG